MEWTKPINPAREVSSRRLFSGSPTSKPFSILVAAEYLAKGYTLSDQILQRAIELDNKQGISRRFLSYFQSLDTSLGARALGPGKTISGGLQGTIAHAKEVDEQKGYSKQATDVSCCESECIYLADLSFFSIIRGPFPHLLVNESRNSTRPHPNRFTTSTMKPEELLIPTKRHRHNLLPRKLQVQARRGK